MKKNFKNMTLKESQDAIRAHIHKCSDCFNDLEKAGRLRGSAKEARTKLAEIAAEIVKRRWKVIK